MFAAAAACVVFAPSASFGWVNWDDPLILLHSEGWHSGFIASLRWAWVNAPGGAWQPLAYLSYGLDYLLWEMEPRGYHLTNILLHALNAALVALIARKLLSRASPRKPGEPAWVLEAAALFAALIFAVHPLRVESISWAAERRDPLSGALWLGAVFAYLRARVSGRSRGSLVAVYILFVAACLAKPIAVTLPLVLLALDVWPLRCRWAGTWREKIPMLAIGAVLGVFSVSAQRSADAAWTWADHGPAARAAQALYAFVFYMGKTAWPSGLSPLYELYPPLNLLEARFLLSAAAVAGAIFLAWRWRRERPWLAAAGVVYGIVLLPVSGLAQSGAQLVADRYSYLAALPWAVLAGGALRAALRRGERRLPAGIAAGAVSFALAAACVAQQSHWKDSEALWNHALAVDPRSPTAWLNLGFARMERGSLPEASDAFARALAADPACPILLGRLPAPAALAALKIRPVCRKSLTNLGASRAQLGDRVDALKLLRLARMADPGSEAARHDLERIEALSRGRNP